MATFKNLLFCCEADEGAPETFQPLLERPSVILLRATISRVISREYQLKKICSRVRHHFQSIFTLFHSNTNTANLTTPGFSGRYAKARSLVLIQSALILSLQPFPVHAHAVAGDRVFPATLVTDDPSVASEVSLPTVDWFPAPRDGIGNVPSETDIGAELDVLVAPNSAVGISDAWTSQIAKHEAGTYGYQSVEVSGKYLFFENDEHEVLMSAGLVVDVGGTGASSVGDDGSSTFTPTFYFGKGMGDLPDSMALLKPFAVTGTIGLALAQNRANPDVFQPGISVEYSMQYLKSSVKDYDLPEFIDHLIPVVELPLTLGLNSGDHSWGGTVNPGVIYLGNSWQIGLEAMIPVSAATQHGTGVIGQVHVFLDDLLPAFSKPIFGGNS